jgi:hypothetical protein
MQMSFSSGSRFHFRTGFVFREKYRNLQVLIISVSSLHKFDELDLELRVLLVVPARLTALGQGRVGYGKAYPCMILVPRYQVHRFVVPVM